jgi:hypothetical protein
MPVRKRGIWRTDIELPNDELGTVANRRLIQQHGADAADDRRAIVNTKNRVLGQREFEEQPTAMPVLRHVRDARLAAPARIECADVAPAEGDRSEIWRLRQQAGECFNQLRLAVSFHTGNADDFTTTHLERHVVQAAFPVTTRNRKIAHAQHRRPWCSRRLLDSKQHVASDHRSGEFRDGRLARLDVAHHPAVPHHVTLSEIASTSDSLCVMMTTVFPCTRMRRRIAKKLPDLLWRQHGRRLVEMSSSLCGTAPSRARRAAAGPPRGPRRSASGSTRSLNSSDSARMPAAAFSDPATPRIRARRQEQCFQ